jgi:DNA-binding XRE family transcriptional regulator
LSEKPCGAYFFAFFENFFVPILTSGGLAAVSSSAFAALYSAFGKYDVVHIHAEGPAFFTWLPKMFGKRVVVAAKVNCSREYIVQIENGTKVPSLSVLVKIANTLSVSADELLLDCLEWTKANKPTAGRTKAIHRRLELSFDLYLLLLFVGQNRASKSHLI